MTGWQAINSEFPAFASLPADAISHPLRIAGDTRSAAVEFVDTPASSPANRTGNTPGHLGRRRGQAGAHQDHHQPDQATPCMTTPARAGGRQETTGPSPGFPASQPPPEAFRPASRNHQNLPTRTGDGLVPADAPEPLAPSTGRSRL